MSKDNGGYSFPHVEHNGDGSFYRDIQGITLRDYFAGKAITGTLPGDKVDEKILAQWAYRMADAMIAARGS